MKRPKILITGFNGFVGQHACKEFRNQGFEIIGLTNVPIDKSAPAYALVDEIIVCDLSDSITAKKLTIPPLDAVLNLAGFATNTGGDAELIHKINIGVHVNLYTRIAELGLSPRIIAISSGTVYEADQPMPLTEDSALKDPAEARPYESSKLLMERAMQPFINQGLDIIIARPFNHIGPGQGQGFIVPDFATQLIKQDTILVGNLKSKRDFTDVRDVVKAYAGILTARKLNHGIYNICSGRSVDGETILDLLIGAHGQDFEVVVDPSKIRANEAVDVYGSPERIKKDIGWVPTIPLTATIDDYFKTLK